ncbi:MAG: DUF721 domain-containing protein [Syntrophales bacterium]|nr:DUF721 domain-containing protein [Syntrophales bacterium]
MRKRIPQAKLQRLDDILQTTLKRRKIFLDLEDKRLLPIWNKAVGLQIAAQTRPGKLKGETLFVKVSSSVWMQQLHFLKEEIIEKINQSLGKAVIKNIYFFLGEISLPSLKGEERMSFPSLSHVLKDRDRRLIEKSTASIPDQELREIMKRVMTKEISRRRFMEKQKHP